MLSQQDFRSLETAFVLFVFFLLKLGKQMPLCYLKDSKDLRLMDVPDQGRSATERTAHSSYLHYNMYVHVCMCVSVFVPMAACEYAEFCPLTPYKTISENATYSIFIEN